MRVDPRFWMYCSVVIHLLSKYAYNLSIYLKLACGHTSERVLGVQVLILGAGPNRIGQGIEFDYCCCHASFSLR